MIGFSIFFIGPVNNARPKIIQKLAAGIRINVKTPNTMRKFSGEFHASAGKIPAANNKALGFFKVDRIIGGGEYYGDFD